MVVMPSRSSRACITLPAPRIMLMGLSRRKDFASPMPITAKPRGLSSSLASLARNLLPDNPTETVIPTSRSMRLASPAMVRAGLL